MSRSPAPRGRAPRGRTRRSVGPDAAAVGSPVQVRLIGRQAAVERLAAAMAAAAGEGAGPVSYRPARDGGGVRAYLTVVVPPDEPDQTVGG